MIKRLKCLLIIFIAVAVFFFMIPGCHTIEGLGKDIKKAGQAIEKKAKKDKKKDKE